MRRKASLRFKLGYATLDKEDALVDTKAMVSTAEFDILLGEITVGT